MSQIMHTLRFVVGMAMLAGGAVLARPFVSAVLAARQGGAPAAAAATAGPQAGFPAMMIGGGHAIPDARQPAAPAVSVADVDRSWPSSAVAAQGQPSPALPGPPAPPAPLPASGLDFSPAAPALEGTYRSTVDIPPPPLLDGHAPPPLAAGWSVHQVAKPPVAGPAIQPSALAADYVVRDGDDLTGIALKIYGHAGAATAIWAANRDRLTDPQLLPIGLSLRLPPSWTLPAGQASQAAAAGLAIEPSLANDPLSDAGRVAAGPRHAAPQARSEAESFWLQGAATGSGAVPETTSTPTPLAMANRPAAIRVAMGDSLESIAVRFYGERGMATRIWQANRDRLRSPDLLVPGVELRLP
jgi:nucleoid-associated protein YgaU